MLDAQLNVPRGTVFVTLDLVKYGSPTQATLPRFAEVHRIARYCEEYVGWLDCGTGFALREKIPIATCNLVRLKRSSNGAHEGSMQMDRFKDKVCAGYPRALAQDHSPVPSAVHEIERIGFWTIDIPKQTGIEAIGRGESAVAAWEVAAVAIQFNDLLRTFSAQIN